jgi:hypothetical protein
VTGFLASLARFGGVAAAALAAGWLATPGVLPPGRAVRLERFAWSWAIGAGLVALSVPLSFLAGLPPGWLPFLTLAALGAAGGRLLRVRPDGDPPPEAAPEGETVGPAGSGRAVVLLRAIVVVAALVYLLRALTEPMWSNDFVAIWGLKGKAIYIAREVPRRLIEDPSLGFSHPEYPIGLPFLYAGASFLAGGWDDHAMALLFPIFQVATLLALVGWLRRRGASPGVAWTAAALLACFEPLYSAFLTGMAEIPLSLGLLLFGTAFADALEGEPGALRRLAMASALITATKNEGLFFAAAGCGVALLFGARRRWKAALAALPTALLVHGAHLAWRGRLPLRDFAFDSLSPARVGEALGAAARLPGAAGWAELFLLAALVALGARVPEGRWMLALGGCALAAYLLLPVFGARGPGWLMETSLPRTAAGLAPLAAAAIAIRYRDTRGRNDRSAAAPA